MSTTAIWVQPQELSYSNSHHHIHGTDAEHAPLISHTDNITSSQADELHKTITEAASTEVPQINSIDSPTNTLSPIQNALVLHAVKEKYTLVSDHAVPSILHQDEILVKITAIGLNPIDWKAPAFNFGIPSLPWVFGRDLAGTVIQTSSSNSRLKAGDLVLVPSTDYRDIRKAAFQEYAVATHYNAAKIPPTTSMHSGASIGVAYVAAALALGVSFGLDFGLARDVPGPNLRQILRQLDVQEIPEDVREECLHAENDSGVVQKGDWIAIWGASTTTGYIALQLAKLCGLKVICIADIARHGAKLHAAGADILVDRFDTNRAVEIIKGVTNGRLRFGLDIVGRETATILEKTLFTSEHDGPQAHLLGLTGLPKEKDPRIKSHTVPIKIFHSSATVGVEMVTWLERLLENGALVPPDVVVKSEGGLEGINDALEVLRSGEASGKRIVVNLGKDDR
ncbi:putative oxidoreductase [Talaromyces proteolyticus]|uniref:Oxidoreductase n=1 Tax=Talaromyces proteolyticus TaxID=1131652 RepID=A0AAD4KLQ4_9EURO|nr:putative oxidoreductase [Talaromyces proteolyticus]KAH8691377.1 putative oxidoreductase [Talaromyces proteolyticus]